MTLKRHIQAKRVCPWTRPYGIVDSGFGDDFRVHSGVAGQDEYILHADCKADIGLPSPDATECVSEVDVVKTEE